MRHQWDTKMHQQDVCVVSVGQYWKKGMNWVSLKGPNGILKGSSEVSWGHWWGSIDTKGVRGIPVEYM